MSKQYIPSCKEEEEFLKNYDPDRYEKPSVTADIVVFTLNDKNEFSVLLIKRGGYPYKDKWAIPGGFANMDESIDETAARELKEETNIDNLPISQIGTFGDVGRDPRMRVISVAYMAFVPRSSLDFVAGDDAQDADIFRIDIDDNDFITLVGDKVTITENDLAFDHNKVIRTAIERLRNRIDYTNDAFRFLKDDQSFTIHELKKIYENVKYEKLDTPNFRRDFIREYVKTGKVVLTGSKAKSGGRDAATYRLVK